MALRCSNLLQGLTDLVSEIKCIGYSIIALLPFLIAGLDPHLVNYYMTGNINNLPETKHSTLGGAMAGLDPHLVNYYMTGNVRSLPSNHDAIPGIPLAAVNGPSLASISGPSIATGLEPQLSKKFMIGDVINLPNTPTSNAIRDKVINQAIQDAINGLKKKK